MQPEIWPFSENYYQLPEAPLVQPKIGIIWSFSQNYHQLPKVPLVQPKIGIIWSFFQISTSCLRYPWYNLKLVSYGHLLMIIICCPIFPCSQILMVRTTTTMKRLVDLMATPKVKFGIPWKSFIRQPVIRQNRLKDI